MRLQHMLGCSLVVEKVRRVAPTTSYLRTNMRNSRPGRRSRHARSISTLVWPPCSEQAAYHHAAFDEKR